METKTHSQKGKPKFPIFEDECKKYYKEMLQALKKINWPARQSEVNSYIGSLNYRISNKTFTKTDAKDFLATMDHFLFLYKTITGGDLKMTRLPGEKQLHDAYRKLIKEIHRKIITKKENTDGRNPMEISRDQKTNA